MITADRIPPAQVKLAYHSIGAGHAITADGLPGLYVGGASLKTVFQTIIIGLNQQVSDRCGCFATYAFDIDFFQFEKYIDAGVDGFVVNRVDQS